MTKLSTRWNMTSGGHSGQLSTTVVASLIVTPCAMRPISGSSSVSPPASKGSSAQGHRAPPRPVDLVPRRRPARREVGATPCGRHARPVEPTLDPALFESLAWRPIAAPVELDGRQPRPRPRPPPGAARGRRVRRGPTASRVCAQAPHEGRDRGRLQLGQEQSAGGAHAHDKGKSQADQARSGSTRPPASSGGTLGLARQLLDTPGSGVATPTMRERPSGRSRTPRWSSISSHRA